MQIFSFLLFYCYVHKNMFFFFYSCGWIKSEIFLNYIINSIRLQAIIGTMDSIKEKKDVWRQRERINSYFTSDQIYKKRRKKFPTSPSAITLKYIKKTKKQKKSISRGVWVRNVIIQKVSKKVMEKGKEVEWVGSSNKKSVMDGWQLQK